MPIYTPAPVNRQHRFNRGLVAWYKCLPHLSGGRSWYDLMGLNPGTLTNMGAGSGWGGSPAPGGFGSLRFDGTNDYVGVPLNLATKPSTLSLWMRVDVFGPSDGSPVFVHSGSHYWAYNGSAKTLEFYNGNWRSSGALAVSAGQWHHYCMVATTVDTTMYFDGVQVYNAAQVITTGSSTTALGARTDSLASPNILNGALDNIRSYSRALSAVEVAWLYQDERLGNPATLNRLGGLTAGQQARPWFVDGECSSARFVEG